MSCSFMKLIYQKFSCISVLSQAELGMQLKTQLNWDQNCIFTEWNELDVRSAMFGMAEFWVSDFESIRNNFLLCILCFCWSSFYKCQNISHFFGCRFYFGIYENNFSKNTKNNDMKLKICKFTEPIIWQWLGHKMDCTNFYCLCGKKKYFCTSGAYLP